MTHNVVDRSGQAIFLGTRRECQHHIDVTMWKPIPPGQIGPLSLGYDPVPRYIWGLRVRLIPRVASCASP